MPTFDSDTPMYVFGVPGRLTHRTTKPDKPARLWFMQRWISEARPIKGYGQSATLHVEMRFDDELGNGHNTFAVTAEVRRPKRHDIEAGGCLHDDIATVFPELAPLIKWHLTSSDGPMHYLANTLYHAQTGRLDYARSSAVWPEATDADLLAPTLRETLIARLQPLLADFRSAMEAAGFRWQP